MLRLLACFGPLRNFNFFCFYFLQAMVSQIKDCEEGLAQRVINSLLTIKICNAYFKRDEIGKFYINFIECNMFLIK